MDYSAGLIIIGDEILNGDVLDTNTHYLAKKLYSIGVQLKKVSVIPDDKETIIKEVREFSSTYRHVFTSGGIGPTHDDRTYEAVAAAFDDHLHFHPILLRVIQKYFHMKDDEIATAVNKLSNISSTNGVVDSSALLDAGIDSRLKLAYVPSTANLLYKEVEILDKFPVVSIKNVFLLPGIPNLFERCIRELEDRIAHPSTRLTKNQLYINCSETKVAALLNTITHKFPLVTVGSYPIFNNSFYKVRITLESSDEKELEKSCGFIHSSIPKEFIVNFDPQPLRNSYEKLVHFMNDSQRCSESLKLKLLTSLEIIENAYQKYKWNEIFISYNGGKDCSVLLHLWHAILSRNNGHVCSSLQTKRLALYIRSKQTFPEVEEFMQATADEYELVLTQMNGPLKLCLETFLTKHETQCRAVFMGTRQSDPRGASLSSECPTDADWPALMRINPILQWKYDDVWTFMRGLCIPYCCLYDRGYTSLGSVENTHPNPHLRTVDENGLVKFLPAYRLPNGDENERKGRN